MSVLVISQVVPVEDKILEHHLSWFEHMKLRQIRCAW